ncbi:MAG TPA: F0F1 ATP synthase subunit delta [Burkholderiales bacterium]|jgi:F-type H+-transporting ATPase subunit delta|nr:F0F1 ATP synthase subunit delta [Burkholderiales bacterium]
MAELATIARPYAEAVFRLAKEGNALAAWSETLAFVAVVYQDPQMQAAISNPKVTANDVERLILAICGERIDGTARNLIQLLVRNRRLAVLPQIREQFEKLKLEDEGKVDAKISSAYPLDAAQRNQVVNLLSSHFKRNINATVTVDPELIGGIKVEVGDKVWDASVRGRLQTMAVTLTK